MDVDLARAWSQMLHKERDEAFWSVLYFLRSLDPPATVNLVMPPAQTGVAQTISATAAASQALQPTTGSPTKDSLSDVDDWPFRRYGETATAFVQRMASTTPLTPPSPPSAQEQEAAPTPPSPSNADLCLWLQREFPSMTLQATVEAVARLRMEEDPK